MPPPRIQIEEARDFAGGWNLNDDPYNIEPNESFDLQDVDIDRRGGFGVRRGSRRFINTSTQRKITATDASRTANVVTATGLSPANGDPGGLVPGQQISVTFADTGYNGTFVVTSAVASATTAQWIQTAANDASAGAGTIIEGPGTPDSGYTYVDGSFVRHILVARAGQVKRWDGANWQLVRSLIGGTGRTRFVEMNNTLYLGPGGNVPHKWTGSGTSTGLTTTVGNFNDDLTAPNSGNFPQCNTFAVWHNVMWAGGTVEAGGSSFSRLRWSHPFQPEDWRTDDWIDLDPDDENGQIRALVPFGERLLVFKDRAIYAVHGYPPDGFSVTELTKQLGTPSQWSVKATENAVYFWDTDRGLWSFDGSNFDWAFERLYPLIDDRKINVQFSFQSIVEIHNDRVWVSVPYLAPPYANTFVTLAYAPNTGKKGAWTLHTKTLFGWWIHRGSDGGDIHLVGGNTVTDPGFAYLYELDVENYYQDEKQLVNGVFQMLKIPAHYTTRWFDGGVAVQKKRWKRPEFVLRSGSNQVTVAEVLSDYDPTKVEKTFQLITALPSQSIEQTYLELNAVGELMMESKAPGVDTSFNVSGTLLIGVDIDPVSISTGTPQTLVSLWDSSGAGVNHSYLFQINSTGFPRIITTPDGTIASQIISTCSAALPDALRRTVWVEFNPNNGANRVVKFYTSDTLSGAKTQLGTTITSTTTSLWPIFDWTLDVGTITPGNTERFDGKMYAFEIRENGILKGQPLMTGQAPGAPSFFDAQGNSWLMLGGATLVGETLVVTDEGIWDVGKWDQMFWARELVASGERSAVVRGAPLGSGRAKAIRLRPTSVGQDWRVNGLTVKWIGKRIRN